MKTSLFVSTKIFFFNLLRWRNAEEKTAKKSRVKTKETASHEAIIGSGEKTVHVVYTLLTRSLLKKGVRAYRYPLATTTPSPSYSVDTLFEDDVTVILLLGVFFYAAYQLLMLAAHSTKLYRYIGAVFRIRILNTDPDPGGQKWPTKKSSEKSCFEALDVLFWGLKASPVAWTSYLEA